TFSTRWSVFRFGGGEAENITVSNCIIYETYGCPIKMRCGPRSRFENLMFSNLVMKNVTGPISIGLGPGQTRRAVSNPPATQIDAKTNASPDLQTSEPATPGVVRNITFTAIPPTLSQPLRL